MRIIGPPSVRDDKVLETLQSLTATGFLNVRFLEEMFEPLWDRSMLYHIDPVGVIAQAIKETNGGKFTGKVPAPFHNTGGIKVKNQHLALTTAGLPLANNGDHAIVHQMFPNWDVGALAHVQHVCAYAGWYPICVQDTPIVDPRWDWVWGKHQCEDWVDLGVKWAPSAGYGHEIENLMLRLGAGV